MTLKRIGLTGFIFVACLAGYLTVQTGRVTTDPASSMAGFLLFRVHCPTPESYPECKNGDPAATIGHLHLYQATFPF